MIRARTQKPQRRIMDQNQREEKMKSRPDWSNMCVHAMQLILESLSYPDFHRARSVCKSWFSVSESCVYKYPWLIIFPEKYSGSESCKLYDPREDKTYETKNLGIEVSESKCIASYCNWLLMVNHRLCFSILNVFSGERINLPPVKLRGKVKFRRPRNAGFLLVDSRDNDVPDEPIFHTYITTGMLWIDEERRDFVVSWIYNDRYLFTYKNGDKYWWLLEDEWCMSMAYKDQKLYVYVYSLFDDLIKILDFSGDFPMELVEEELYLKDWFSKVPVQWSRIRKRRIAITSSGDVVIVLSLKGFAANPEERLFYVFKVIVKSKKSWKRVDSLGGNEMLVFGDGLTLSASGKESGLIYFVADDLWPPRDYAVPQNSAGVFDLKTVESDWFRFPYCSSNDRWFVPRY